MTGKLEVDPKVYYQAATNCFDAAAALNDSFKYVFGELNSCGHMAGRDEDGHAWGTSYDESARDAVAFFDQTFATLRAYGTALNDLGFEHAKSDAALKGTAQPDRPQDQASTVTFGPYALPASAAGGAPQGLLKASVEVLDAINCPLPDGNTDTLAKAADAWDRLGRVYQNTNAKDKITIAASLFDGVTSQDAVQVREDLKTLETSIGALLDTCKAISKTCLDYKESIEELRKEIKGFIDAIIQEAAIDMAITVIATCLTGVGGLIAGAKAVESARRWSIKIKAAVTAWRARKALQLKGLADDAKTVLAKGKQAVKDLRERLRASKDGPGKREPSVTNSPEFDGSQAANDLRARLAANGESVANSRNVAVARGQIDGQNISLDAVSGARTPSGTVEAPGNPILRPESVDGSVVRPADSEFKILDNLAQNLRPDSKGSINLYTERAPCDACTNVIEQFKQRFPGVEVNVTYG
ncbi:deaminase domain-containing protein [Nocardia brasiliensis]|uniref:deaminase domain-containing protein n=1 Tax=Nocardia brasiliensis TaxID=37326 RepID=UPI002454EAED|nr:deaminase domain-containing protein [Nocardia brasiliensis]